MLNCFSRKPFFNKILNEFCSKSTMESIRKITEAKQNKTELEKTLNYEIVSKMVCDNDNNNNNDNNTSNNISKIVIFLSVSSLVYYFIRYCKR